MLAALIPRPVFIDSFDTKVALKPGLRPSSVLKVSSLGVLALV